MSLKIFVCLLFLVPSISVAAMPADDTVKGAKDHPLLSRYAGSKLVGFATRQFEEVDLPAGKKVDNKKAFEKTQKIEGKLTRIIYAYPSDRSSIEVMRNYQAALQKAELKTLFSCDKESCGKDFGDLMLSYLDRGGFRGEGSTDYWASPFNYGRGEPRYLLASGKRADGSTAFVSVYVTPPTGGKLGGV
jgi:OmpA-OmpF porin, OOP family